MKEGLIKQLKKGNLILEHSRILVDGFWRDYFQMVKISLNPKDKVARTIKPFFGNFKVNNFRPEDPITTTTDYTEEDYEEMFEENKF